MKKFFIALSIILHATLSGAQQIDTTGVYAEKTDSLSAAGVVAQRNLVRLKADRITYDVGNDIDARSMTVLDMLRKIPMVNVGADDSITIGGSSSFKVYVDGRPDQMLTANPSRMFRAMPASNIKTIEVVTNPGARYDAEGVGGVLEITTFRASRKALHDGIYGDIMGYGNSTGSGYGSLSLSARLGKWTVSSDLQPSSYHTSGLESLTENNSRGHFSREEKRQSIVNNSYTGTFSANFEPDSLNLISASIGLDHSPNWGRMDHGHFEAANAYSYDMTAAYDETWSSVKGSLDWQHRSRKNPDRILTLSWQISDNPARTRDTTFIANVSGVLPFDADNILLIKDNKTLENTFQADLTTPVGASQSLSTGAKLILRHFGTEATDGTTPTDYDYHSNIGAAYAEYTGSFGHFTLTGGLRYEHTWQDYSQTGNSFSLDYGNLVPNASIQYTLSTLSNLSLTYNLRIGRPGISLLSPYINRTTPNYISYGNPDLEAEKSHRLNLIYNYSGPRWIISARLADYFSDNGIERYTIFKGDIAESTYGNIVRRNAVEANIYVSCNASGKTRLSFSADGEYQHYRSEVLGLRNEGFGVSTVTGIQQVLPWDISLSSYLYLSTKSHTLQGWYKDKPYISVRLAKSFLEDKLTIVLFGVTDFGKGKLESTSWAKGRDFSKKDVSLTPWRTVGLGISWTFGKKRIEVKKASRSIVNDDTVGG